MTAPMMVSDDKKRGGTLPLAGPTAPEGRSGSLATSGTQSMHLNETQRRKRS
jgi:hypothetical protein